MTISVPCPKRIENLDRNLYFVVEYLAGRTYASLSKEFGLSSPMPSLIVRGIINRMLKDDKCKAAFKYDYDVVKAEPDKDFLQYKDLYLKLIPIYKISISELLLFIKNNKEKAAYLAKVEEEIKQERKMKLLTVKLANQGGYQPAMVEGLANVLNELESFTTTENHIDFPNTVLHVPKLCVGIVERSLNNSKEGSVSILFKDTITARRLIARAEK